MRVEFASTRQASAFVGFFYVPLLLVLTGLVWGVLRWRRKRRM